ncbi:MAG: glycine cleavage system protein T [Limimaricola sp.]|uniref:glycine cleavage T C-terminal barrel domain-containing protein n=1 Tax=Limimaricola sp. TaxID=2211665 RepID=UPI001D97DFE4|nr:glycine cleavage T C-terminal barrel domain-containing protein [Limimaricola sp.]MBI1418605.1 glycine cleavage system protein T [Limimaricola sp.]
MVQIAPAEPLVTALPRPATFQISPSARLRPSPFFEATVAEGVTAMTTYNHMLMPTSYGHPEEEYWRLINGVSMWDVSCERQVQLAGPDAGRLAQILATRDLSKCKVGQGKYVALCNHDGVLINDPILLKLDEDRYWLSIADSNIWFWARAIAAERGLRVEVSEPDVSPLAVQGPRAEDVVASICGDWVRDLKYFWFRETEIAGIPVAVQRSGWSKQGGFEIYLKEASRGAELWAIVKEAGQPYGIGPGNPNWVERIESGLVSYGGDTDGQTNPFEVRMGKYVDLHVPDDTIGIQALRRIAAEGPKRHSLGIRLDGGAPAAPAFRWNDIVVDGIKAGDLTNCAWSWRLEQNIGFALVSVALQPGDRVTVLREDGPMGGTLCEIPFL